LFQFIAMAASPQPVQSVSRALNVLEALAERAGRGEDEVGVTELAAATGLSAPTVHRLLATLLDGGYVARGDGSIRYRLGPRLFSLAASAESPLARVRERVAPVMEELRDRFGETVNLAVLDRRHIVYIHQVESQRSVRAFNRIGNRVLAHASAAGKALLAHTPPATLEALLGVVELEALTPATLTSFEALSLDLQLVRSRGYALDLGEQDAEIVCVAAPVPAAGLRPAAAVSVSGPAARVRALDLDLVGAEIVAALRMRF
jgi:IclR family acetate operon transcriptional repressor